MGMETRSSRFDLLQNPVEFVTAAGDDVTHEGLRSSDSEERPSNLTGEEAKIVYENILSESRNNGPESQNPIEDDAKEPDRKELKFEIPGGDAEQLSKQDFFKGAQAGDLELVKRCVEQQNLDKNIADGYSWTPLMMAAYEGHEEVVLYLLASGASWFDVIDGSGYDARDLACIGGHTNIANIFTNRRKYVRKWRMKESEREISQTIKRERIWCDMCKIYFHASTTDAKPDPHYTSTLHLFNDKERALPADLSYYHLTHSNRGFQIMQRGGWDGSSGLGPDGAGQKYPVKTILKRDRLGFGAEDKTAVPRVTHFAAEDDRAVKRHRTVKKSSFLKREPSSRAKRKAKVSCRDNVQKQKEIDFRREFH